MLHKTLVARLAARFAVKGRLIEDELHRLAGGRLLDRLPVAQNHQQPDFILQPVIAGKLGRINLAQRLLIVGLDRFHRPGAAGPLPLLVHGRIVAGDIDRHPLLARDVHGDVEGKPVRVIEPEGLGAGNGFTALALHLLHHLAPPLHAVVQHLEKALFLRARHLGNQLTVLLQLGIGGAHRLHHHARQLVQKRPLQPQLAAVAHGAAHDPPQDIATPLVGGHHAVADQHRERPRMVGDHPGALHVDQRRGRAAGLLGQRLEIGRKEVGPVIIADALRHGGDPLKPHASVNARLGQRRQGAGRFAVVLHEDEIPDFQVAVAIAVKPAAGGAMLHGHGRLSLVIMDFGAGAAGARLAHLPEIIRLILADDPIG